MTIHISYNEDTKTLTVSGTGVWNDVPDDDLEFCRICETVQIMEGITSVDFSVDNHDIKGVFFDNLKRLIFPSTLCDFVPSLFGFYRIEEYIVDDSNPNYSSLDGVLFNKEQTRLIDYPEDKKGDSYEIPNTVTAL